MKKRVLLKCTLCHDNLDTDEIKAFSQCQFSGISVGLNLIQKKYYFKLAPVYFELIYWCELTNDHLRTTLLTYRNQ